MSSVQNEASTSILALDFRQFPRRAEALGSLRCDFTQHTENFRVDEIPAYLPCGEGEHLFVSVCKRDCTTKYLIDTWCRKLGIQQRDIGYAGLKDRRATSTQWLSIATASELTPQDLSCDNIEILDIKRHRNKLRIGHLRGNRFDIAIKDLDPSLLSVVRDILSLLELRGLPNFFGSQRMGRNDQNRADGKAVALGQKKVSRWQHKFLLSAYQSALFNDLLAHRMKLNLLDTVLQGDWLQKLDTGGSFICTEPEIDQPRADRLEISPTAPMFGPRVEPSQGLPGEWEQQILQREDITLDTFRAWGKDALGTRRALRVPVSDIQTQFDSGCLRLCFTLPPGSYASVLLQELGIDFL